MSDYDDGDNPYDTPQHSAPPPGPHGGGDATGGVIPYKNPPALIAYYLGLFSIIPCVGLLLAIPAFILGIIGLKKRSENPEIKGALHAWIGIIGGGLMTLLWGGLLILMFVGSATR